MGTIWLGLLLLAAQDAPPPDVPSPPRPERGGRLFISPMGEPFRASDPIKTWFDGADTNHDGFVTLAEFTADADRFFAVLDRAHDGEIDPGDIEYYETVLAPEIRIGGGGEGFGGGGGGKRGGGRRGGGGGGRHGGGGHRGGGGESGSDSDGAQSGADAIASPVGTYDAQARGAARFGFFEYPEPVTAADTNLNRGVSRTEFRNAARQRFALLDKADDGRLTPADLPRLSGSPDRAPDHRRGGHGGGYRRGGGPDGVPDGD